MIVKSVGEGCGLYGKMMSSVESHWRDRRNVRENREGGSSGGGARYTPVARPRLENHSIAGSWLRFPRFCAVLANCQRCVELLNGCTYTYSFAHLKSTAPGVNRPINDHNKSVETRIWTILTFLYFSTGSKLSLSL